MTGKFKQAIKTHIGTVANRGTGLPLSIQKSRPYQYLPRILSSTIHYRETGGKV